MTSKELIKSYRKMKKISTICEENNIDRSNVVQGKSTDENEKILAEEIIKELVPIVNEFFKVEDKKNEKRKNTLDKRKNKERKCDD